MRSVGLSPVLELWVGVVGACTRLQTVAWSLSVINTQSSQEQCARTLIAAPSCCGQRERASLNLRVHTWAEQLDK